MNALLHTPGPWMANFTRMNGDAIHWHVADKKRGTVNAVAVADEEQGEARSASELEANAHLIAAAPELLAASRLIMNSFAYAPGAGPIWYEAARAAIAKATGATS